MFAGYLHRLVAAMCGLFALLHSTALQLALLLSCGVLFVMIWQLGMVYCNM